MGSALLLDYRAEHGGKPCRLIVFENGEAELQRGRSRRRAMVTWRELRDLEKALYRCEIDSLPRYYDGRAIGGVTFSLKYRDYHVRVARCLTRDLWLRFPMLATLEYLVVLLNGWPSLAIHQHHRLRAA